MEQEEQEALKKMQAIDPEYTLEKLRTDLDCIRESTERYLNESPEFQQLLASLKVRVQLARRSRRPIDTDDKTFERSREKATEEWRRRKGRL